MGVTGPATITSWEGYAFTADAPDQRDGSGRAWRFASWADGGPARRRIATPAEPATYEASFAPD